MIRSWQAGWLILLIAVSIVAATSNPSVSARAAGQDVSPVLSELHPTAHPALPPSLGDYWLVPPENWRPGQADVLSAVRDLAKAGDLIDVGKAAQAVPTIRLAALRPTPLYHYGLYTKGLAELALDQFEQARSTLGGLRALGPAGYLSEAAALKEAEADEALKDFAAAVSIYELVLTAKPAAPETVTLRLARAARSAGNEARAIKAFEQIYYEWPTSDAGDTAAQALASTRREPIAAGSARFKRELARAERLYAARRYTQARDNFEQVLPHAAGDTAAQIKLRVAECDYSLRRFQRARDALAPLTKGATRQPEARYFSMMAIKGLGGDDQFVRLVRSLVDQYPDSPWAEDALDSLASYWIVGDEDDKADGVFRELIDRFPKGRHADRARWKVGWLAYKNRQYKDSGEVFDRAAAASPRSDYRPSYLYWAAKSYEKLGSIETSNVRYLLTVTDYANSYYGRLAAAALKSRRVPIPAGEAAAHRFTTPAEVTVAALPAAAASIIQWLISVEMYDEALDEVQFAERTTGTSPALRATRAWLLNRRGDLRPAITIMRQVYPQILAAGGETIPEDVQKIVYPLDYWPLIQKYAGIHNLDPYLVAALIAQESTFDPNALSAAKAIGLMQVLPSTGRRYARVLGMRGFTAKQLTTPEINIRIGTSVFADLVQRFGASHIALCGYNAGDTRAAQWSAERQGLPADEWIDDIPFPETQNYVRRILGTAENYRQLYGK